MAALLWEGLQARRFKLEADPAVIFAHSIEQQLPAISSGKFEGEVSIEEALGFKRAA
ncbi:hypothetical protein [Lysobacter sp. CA199]|uniref:hypothetical protein n=1 Tax=Lysobacter sp. CA199 TaxID=3455608 RepID=UPI003F8D5723